MRRKPSRRSESGVVFVLVLICLTLLFTISILMILSAGTESFLNANYRSSTRVFYAALGGLEEARGRMWPNHPNNLSAFFSPPGATVPVGKVLYIINDPLAQGISPTNLNVSNPYADLEYQQEFGVQITGASGPVQSTNSASSVAGLNGPQFQWVRITPATEKSLNIDVNGGGLDNTTPLFYDGTHLNLATAGRQVFEITSLAVLPNGSKKMLQYVVANTPLTFPSSSPGTAPAPLAFPAALTLGGDLGSFDPTSNGSFWLDGRNLAGGSCASPNPQPAVGGTRASVLNPASGVPGEIKKLPASLQNQYIGSSGTGQQSVVDVSSSIQSIFQSVNSLEGPGGLVDTITQNADYIVQGPTTGLPNYGSPSNPVIVVVQGHPGVRGNLTLTGGVTGYGILLVNGKLYMTGDISWEGIILLVGQGQLSVISYGSGEIDGAIYTARTRDDNNALLSNLGNLSVDFSSGGNNGIYYNSCWINAALLSKTYKVLSFREIPQ